MIKHRDDHPDQDKSGRSENQVKRKPLLTAVPKGYQPDDDDPAWPSRSGQAD